ncbi:MAG: hypothetical protein PHC75_06110 [Burkholderiales bacterium]|nr:hypothetical protein [Burkholderiales bacterium]
MTIQAIGALANIGAQTFSGGGTLEVADLASLDNLSSDGDLYGLLGNLSVGTINNLNDANNLAMSSIANITTSSNTHDALKIQSAMENLNVSSTITATVLKQVNKAVDSLVHIQ